MAPDEILSLYEEAGRPSTAKFARALRKRGMRVTDEDVQKNIVALQGDRQLRAPPPKYLGKIFSLGLDDKWFADIMVIPPGRHALIVQDVFSRYIWARKMDGQATVVEPMKDIMRVRRPKILYTDADVAFRSKAFKSAMESLGVESRIKVGRNDIATVDRAIGILAETIVRYTTSSGDGDWMNHLQKAVKAFNSSDLDYLAHEAPKDVKEGTQLEAFLKRKNAGFLQQNMRLLAGRTNRLTSAEYFRAFLPPPRTGKRRIGDPRWSPEVHRVARVEGNVVFDERGRQYPIKEVLPVAAQSVQPVLLGRGLDLNRQRRKDALEAQRIELENALESAGGEDTVRNLTRRLRQTDFFEVLRREGIGDRRVFESFIGLFPTSFAFVGGGANRSIRLR